MSITRTSRAGRPAAKLLSEDEARADRGEYHQAAGVGTQGMMQCTTSQGIPHHGIELARRVTYVLCIKPGWAANPPRLDSPPGRSTLRSLSETTKLRPTPSTLLGVLFCGNDCIMRLS